MKGLVFNLLTRLLGVMIVLVGLIFFLPILTGTNFKEGILSIAVLVVTAYLGGKMVIAPHRFIGGRKA